MASFTQTSSLLPSGLFDLIGTEAEAETTLVGRFLTHFRSCGYLQVQPPLMEFTASLFGGTEECELARRSFRLTDPVSQQMLAIRADMTMQIARIAGSTLKNTPRPLRLCYAGQTLRSTLDTMRASRQFRQIGIEVFGSDNALADVEVMQTALTALRSLGLEDLTLDLSLPQLLPPLLMEIAPDSHEALLQAITRKEIDRIETLGGKTLAQITAIAEPYETALSKLRALTLTPEVIASLNSIEETIKTLNDRLGFTVNITLDPLEMRGFGYHNGLSFSIYAPGRPQELGRGGRYLAPHGENATGFTLYAEDIYPLLEAIKTPETLLLPAHCDEQTAAAWRAKGYRTQYALTKNTASEARVIGCQNFLNDDLTNLTKAT